MAQTIYHEESTIKVYQSKEFRRFAKVTGNRRIVSGKLKKMITAIEAGQNYLADFPILTTLSKDGKLNILDGQHRFEAAKATKNPVYYLVRQELQLDKIAQVNSMQEKWKSADFIACYIERGNQHYRELQDFQDTYSFPLGTALTLLYYGVTGSPTVNASGAREELKHIFQCGEFKVKHMKQAKDIAEACRRFKASPYWNTRGFIVAIMKVLSADLIELDELVAKFDKDPSQLTVHGNYKDYLVNLEVIFNKNNSKRRVIH